VKPATLGLAQPRTSAALFSQSVIPAQSFPSLLSPKDRVELL
jgi:hypothetical protein